MTWGAAISYTRPPMSMTTGAGGLVKRFFLIGFVGLAGCEGGEAFIGLDGETEGEVTVDSSGQKFSSAIATLAARKASPSVPPPAPFSDRSSAAGGRLRQSSAEWPVIAAT